ncbi:MAG: glycosyltransferase family 2 protein, partial [Gemmatimonadales bacterium]
MTMPDHDTVDVSVLVPAADEAENLPEFLRQCDEAFAGLSYCCEVVVVDDGSTDETSSLLPQLKATHAFLRFATHRSRRGIADALRTAGEMARGSILVFYPADLQFLPTEIPRLVEPILAGEADAV